jgi:hypothetical protein
MYMLKIFRYDIIFVTETMDSEIDIIISILRYTKTLKILVIIVIVMIMLLSVQLLVSYILITNIQVECNKNPRIVVIKPDDKSDKLNVNTSTDSSESNTVSPNLTIRLLIIVLYIPSLFLTLMLRGT